MKVPPAGLNVGVATSGTIVYVALATLLFAIPLAAASARSVVVCVTGIGPVYTGPIPVTQTTTLRALAAASGMANSSVASATYTIVPLVATPTFSPAGGTFIASVQVTLTDATPGATIYYTTNGSTPTTASTVDTGPIPVTQTTTLRALAAASGMANSSVASATYTIVPLVATPTFSPAGGTFIASVQVTLTDSTPGATIYYTTNGSTPTTASTVYTGPIPVTQTTTLRALAAATGMANSNVASATYTIVPLVATPTFSPAGGTFVASVQVTLTDSTPGATIYYTTDGSAPTTASTVYTGPIPVTQTTTLCALGGAAS